MISMSDLMPEPTAEELEAMFQADQQRQQAEQRWDDYKQRVILEAIRDGQVIMQGRL
jgi:hypothetical protein